MLFLLRILYIRLPWERPVLDPEAYTGDDYDLPESSVQYYVAGTSKSWKQSDRSCSAEKLMFPFFSREYFNEKKFT